ncbi:MAG TPA: chemotaxis protein CheX [Syntrophomonadaceae bacterium]|nr:chemotaxis protein CheX [Syntrophomonadaceae bacterium]
MRAEYVNSFYKATLDVLKLMLDVEVKQGELSLVEGLVPSKDANVIIGVTGDLKGNILFSFPRDMTLEMVYIMSGMRMEEIDTFVSSALGEVANIIGGNALSNLSASNYNCDIVPPQILIGTYHSVSMANEKAMRIPLITTIGEFDITLYLKENK